MNGMNDMGTDTSQLTPGTSSPASANEQCVPLMALAMPEEGDQMASPEVGDVVTYTVEGKVTRIEGDMAYVEPETVNGKPVEKRESPGEAAADGDAAYQSLEDDADKMGALG